MDPEQLAMLQHQMSPEVLARNDANWAASRADEARNKQLQSLDDIEGVMRAVQEATLSVHAEVERMAAETSRAQKLALWWGAGIALAGSVIGGFAGAIAARIVGS